MSKFHEVLRIFVLDSEKFLVKTLKDVKLSSNAGNERRSLLHQIQNIRQDYVQLDLGEPLGKPELYLKEEKSRKGSTESDGSQTEAALLATNLIRIKDRAKALKFSGKSGKKWMVIRDGNLFIYDKQTSKSPTANIPVAGCSAALLGENKSQVVFQVTTTDSQEYYFAALTTADADLWVKTLNNLKPADPKVSDAAVAELPVQTECEVEQYFYGIEDQKKSKKETPIATENIYEAGDDIYDTASTSSAKTPPSSPAQSPETLIRKPPPIPTPEEEEELYETFNENVDVVKGSNGVAESQRPPPELPTRLPPPLKQAAEKNTSKEKGLEEPEEELYAGIPQDDEEEQEEYGEVDDIYDEALSPPIAEDDELYDEVMSAPNHLATPRQSTVSSTLPDGRPNFFHKLYYTKTPYTGRASHELSLGLGTQLHVLDRDLAEKQGWAVGKAGTKVGLVPRANIYPAYQEVDGVKEKGQGEGQVQKQVSFEGQAETKKQ